MSSVNSQSFSEEYSIPVEKPKDLRLKHKRASVFIKAENLPVNINDSALIDSNFYQRRQGEIAKSCIALASCKNDHDDNWDFFPIPSYNILMRYLRSWYI